ncbi:hypothetical protein BRARA_E02847 [Brassica rapa]|uniref:Bifunctional inhibitor/plant lipid transfer protein/seed storage helical domain-containing protein n=4 Tax=Brassica TaxID=3705 RepID=A0A0D3CKV1_BRAOL|nr:hypothetical protein BRARA_E02847 [Brassica rapa]CAF2101924.1 unnamed protein product [Brassica napus]CDY08425.1 BnaA05g26610D [Brassica napus]VDD46657.1 unnamed protein product [Brassica oleracea]
MKIMPLMSIAFFILLISFLDPIKAQGIVGCDTQLDKCITAMNKNEWSLVQKDCCPRLRKTGPQQCMCLLFKYPSLKAPAMRLIKYCQAPTPKC